jgi:methionyl-tRNA formyltransferase
MRLVVFGQAPFGRRVFEGLQAAGHEIALVYAPADLRGRADPLAESAREVGVPLETPATYKDVAVQARVEAAGADLGVLAFVTKIIPEAVIDAPRLGSICYHPSLLPRFRGGSALAWQLIRGETRGGYSIFWTDAGVDSGPILLQREVEIDAHESAGSYYFRELFEPGIAAMVEAVGLAADGTAPRLVQDETLATHDPLCRDEHAAIVWERSCEELHNLVRGCDPQPGAHAAFAGEKLRLYGSRRLEPVVANRASAVPGPAAAPGTILAIDGDGLLVSVGVGEAAGPLIFAKARSPAGKATAAEVAATLNLEPGTRLGNGA